MLDEISSMVRSDCPTSSSTPAHLHIHEVAAGWDAKHIVEGFVQTAFAHAQVPNQVLDTDRALQPLGCQAHCRSMRSAWERVQV